MTGGRVTAAHEALRAMLEARAEAIDHELMAKELRVMARTLLNSVIWYVAQSKKALDRAGAHAATWARLTDAENAEARVSLGLEEQIRKTLEDERVRK